MLGADIDFIVRGIDSKTRSVAVSCREAMRRSSLEDLGIKADIKSISENTDRDNLQKCRIQGKYAGRVTDVHKGVVYVRLSNGVNAVAHSCYDYRTPGKRMMYPLPSPIWMWSAASLLESSPGSSGRTCNTIHKPPFWLRITVRFQNGGYFLSDGGPYFHAGDYILDEARVPRIITSPG